MDAKEWVSRGSIIIYKQYLSHGHSFLREHLANFLMVKSIYKILYYYQYIYLGILELLALFPAPKKV